MGMMHPVSKQMLAVLLLLAVSVRGKRGNCKGCGLYRAIQPGSKCCSDKCRRAWHDGQALISQPGEGGQGQITRRPSLERNQQAGGVWVGTNGRRLTASELLEARFQQQRLL